MATNLTSEATVTAMIKAITDPLAVEISLRYTKPSGGIPIADLASGVKSSLGMADTAVQPDDVFNEGGKVRSDLLPSYVDDVLEYASTAYFPETGESGKIYVANDTNKTYRWGGANYVEISASLALGETSSTAFRGDHGKDAYDHAKDANRLTTAQDSGLYKIATTAEGHVKSVTAVEKSDITGLGIPAQDTTYSNATTSADGLMSSADKVKLNGVEAGAQVNVIETVKVNGTALTPQDKAVNIPVPTLDDTVTPTSANGVKSSGIWSALWGALSALPTGFTSLYDWCVSQLAGKANASDLRYSYNAATVSSGTTPTVTDILSRATNTATLGSSVTAATFTLPAATTGKMRDFYIALTVQGSTAPSLTWIDPATNTDADIAVGEDSLADIDTGLNIVLFSEAAGQNRWIVSVKHEEAAS